MTGPPHVTEVRIAGVDYVIRAEPTGLIESPLPALSFIALSFIALTITAVRRVVRRDRTWAITVRERSQDPFGPVFHREVVRSRQEAADRLGEVVAQATSGEALWRPT